MGKPPIIGIVMGVAGVAGLVFLALLFFSDPGTRSRPRHQPRTSTVWEQDPEVDQPMPIPKTTAAPKRPRRFKRPRKKRPPAPMPTEQAEPPPLQELVTVQDTKPPWLTVIMPRSPAYVMSDSVTIRARSEPGAALKVDRHPFLETATGVYVAKVNLLPGLNRLTVSAADAAGNISRKVLLVTYIEQSRVHRVKDNLMSMLKQLEEIKLSVDEVDAQTEVIINAIADTDDAERVNELSRNLREIRKTKRNLQKEIEKAFREINSLLAKP